MMLGHEIKPLLLLIVVDIVNGIQTHFVYWNSSNPIFRTDNMDHVVDVNSGNLPWEYDQLNLICPNSDEQHVIYSVSREEYMDCRVTSPRPKIVAICNRPERFLYFTITFRSFSPTPGGLEFKPGHTYYLISTSTSRDLHRRAGGYCSTHNMRMIFNVADNSHAESNSVNSEQEPPRRNLYSLYSTTSSTTARSVTPSSIPVYYYKSKTPTVHSSDYIYYYSPRDLVQLKLKAQKLDRVRENEVYRADRLTSSSRRTVSVAESAQLVMLVNLIVTLVLRMRTF
jgi:ephrin-B